MKALKNLGYVLVLVVLALALVGLYLPGSVAIERRVTVAAGPADLFPLLDSPEALTRWAPWATPGTDVRYAFDGPARGVGAGLRWEGAAPPFSSGSATITDVEPDRRVGLRLQLPLLGKAHATFETYPAPEAGSTQVACRLHDDVGFNLLRRLLWLLADWTVGPVLERGLDNLRVLADHR